MKRRLSAVIVALILLISMTPVTVNAASSLSSPPYAYIEYSYTTSTPTGTIRYISQITSSGYFNWNYWPRNGFGGYSSPGTECGTASISMALSYVGINKTPYDILSAHNGYTYFGDNWGGAISSSPSLSSAISNYVNGNGKYSPPIIHLPTYTTAGHYVIIAGKISSSQYAIVDPASDSVGTMTISGMSWSYNGKSGSIDQVYQYYNNSAVIDPPSTTPGKPVLKDFSRLYSHGEITVFNWNSTPNTTHYNLYIDRLQSNGDWEVDYRVWHYAISGFSAGFDDGIYRVLLQATNADADGWPYTNADYVTFVVGPHSHDKGTYMFYEAAHPHCNCYECSVCGTVWRDTSSSNYMDSCLECHRPDKPVITGVSSQYIEQQTITIRWTAGANTTHCNYWLQKKNGSGEWETKHKIDYASSPITETLSAGEYRTFVVATNSNYWEEDGSTWLWIDSDYVYFSVKHKYVDTITPPTCTAQGYTTHTCSICGDSYKDSYTNALGHSYSYSATTAPTTSTTGVLTGTCTRCGATTTITLPKLTTTDYNYSVIQAATCIANGTGRYTWKTTTYGTFSFDVTIPKTGHSYTDTVTPPTCTVQGFTTHTCSRCGDSYKDSYTNALGHAWDSGVVTKPATETETGVKTFTCTRCGETKTELIPKLDGKVNPFVDVAKGKYYYDAVLWAYYHEPYQVTGGTDATHFSPGKTCTREQVVSFLYAANGKPEHHMTANPFTDVKAGKYYYNAVMWAVENKITGGVTETTFGVGKACTREQVVTFLWKAAGAPAPKSTFNPFTDVKTGKYYYKAVLWAVENKITGGTTESTFGVGKPCTRAQVVTFLYASQGKSE